MSELELKTEYVNGRTVISDRRFTAPLKIAKPFYQEKRTEIMVMCASPGMLSGDAYDIRLDMGERTHTAITGQAYQKIHRAADERCRQTVSITVGKDAELWYMPFPVIPFSGSRFQSRTDILLTASSQFLYCEVLQAGRSNEAFSFSEYDSGVRVFVDGRLAFLDHTRLVPREANISGTGFFEGHLCQGMLYGYGYPVPQLPVSDGVEAAISGAREGFCVRMLGDSADAMFSFAKGVHHSSATRI